eukprot:gene5707-4070_t
MIFIIIIIIIHFYLRISLYYVLVDDYLCLSPSLLSLSPSLCTVKASKGLVLSLSANLSVPTRRRRRAHLCTRTEAEKEGWDGVRRNHQSRTKQRFAKNNLLLFLSLYLSVYIYIYILCVDLVLPPSSWEAYYIISVNLHIPFVVGQQQQQKERVVVPSDHLFPTIYIYIYIYIFPVVVTNNNIKRSNGCPHKNEVVVGY